MDASIVLQEMKTAFILSLILATGLATSSLKGSESEVLGFLSSDRVASTLVADFAFFPKFFGQTDSQAKDESQMHDRYYTTYRFLAQTSPSDSSTFNGGWSHWVEVTIEKNASSKFMNVRSVAFTALRHGDAWPCFNTEKVIRLNKEGKVIELLAANTKSAGGADQPATAPDLKSEGKDKPQLESKVAPR